MIRAFFALTVVPFLMTACGPRPTEYPEYTSPKWEPRPYDFKPNPDSSIRDYGSPQADESAATDTQLKAENAKLNRMQEINVAFNKRFGLLLATQKSVTLANIDEHNNKQIARLAEEDLRELRVLCEEFRKLAGETLRMFNNDKFIYKGDQSTIESARATAERVLIRATDRLARSVDI